MSLLVFERLAATPYRVVASDYRYLHPMRDGSGLHAFTLAGTGHVELFAKRKAPPSGWHLIRGAYTYEFVASAETRAAINRMTAP
jgi:hypothetical protein